MATKCTWVECEMQSVVPQTASDGSVWAKLCISHDKQLADAVGSGDVKKLMSAYIKAQGGAKAAADRMAPAATKVIAGIVEAAKKAKAGQ